LLHQIFISTNKFKYKKLYDNTSLDLFTDVPNIIISSIWGYPKSVQKTQSIKNSKILIRKALDMNKKYTVLHMVYFFLKVTKVSDFYSVFDEEFVRRHRSAHTSRIEAKEFMFKVNLFLYSFEA